MPTLENCLVLMRSNGWVVYSHFDVRRVGEDWTCWIFAHPDFAGFAIGEAKTDLEAIADCMKQAGEVRPLDMAGAMKGTD